jgi:hypothetical protein
MARKLLTGRTIGLGGAGLGIAIAWMAFAHALSWHVRVGDSDNANAIFAGHDFVRGNLLLSGWKLPIDSYWLVDLPLIGAFTALFGAGAFVLHAVPVFIAAGVIGLGGALAGRHHRLPAAVVGAATVVIVLGLPHPLLVANLYQSPYHVLTTFFCLVAFALLGKGGRGWWAGVLVLAAAVLGDGLALATGLAPVAAAGLVAALRRRRWGPAVSMAVAAALAGGLARLTYLVVEALGGHELLPAVPLPPPSFWATNLRLLPERVASLLGPGEGSGLSGAFRWAHWAGVVAVAGGIMFAIVRLARAVRRQPSEPPEATPGSGWAPGAAWLDDVVLMAFLGGLGSYVVVTLPPNDLSSLRYLLAPLIYGAVLAGRGLAAAAQRLSGPGRWSLQAGVAAVGAAYFMASLAMVQGPLPPNPERDLARWLVAHDLPVGLSTYWVASIVTLYGEGKVEVRPIINIDGHLRPYYVYAASGWFDPHPQARRQFLAFRRTEPPDPWLGEAVARDAFGPPATSTDVGPYRIMVWDADLFSRLGERWSS